MTDWDDAERACVSGNTAMLRDLLEALAQTGSVKAQRLLGTGLVGAPGTHAEGLRWLQTAADAGDGHAAHNLAVALRMGAPGYPAQPERALHYFELAFSSGFEAEVSTEPKWWKHSSLPGALIRAHRATGGEHAPRFFLNVDLDIESSEDLTPLVKSLEPRAFSLERPSGRASFELGVPVSPSDPEPLILEFVRIVNELPAEARGLWNRAARRVFDIGIQSARRPVQMTHRLAPATLRAAADIDAEIAITIYALPTEGQGVGGRER